MKRYQIGVILFVVCWASAVCSQTILVVTEDGYPLQYMKDQKIVGTGTELVEAVMKQAGLTYTIQIYPWARAYRSAQNQKNVLIYSMTRTPQREWQFKWVGEILPLNYSLLRLKSRPEVAPTSLQDAKSYNIGVIRQDVVHQYLEREEFLNLEPVATVEQNFKKLLAKRVDLIPYTVSMLHFVCKDIKVDCDLFEPVLPLPEISTGLFMAFSNLTDDAIFERAKKAYLHLKQEGIYDDIIGRTLRGEE
jgi:polar amino acid transport system substrate-binding protein